MMLAGHSCWTLKTELSDSEIQKERRYILTERLGILLGQGELTADALSYALEQADQWEDHYMDSI
jgi:hypothetical protein